MDFIIVALKVTLNILLKKEKGENEMKKLFVLVVALVALTSAFATQTRITGATGGFDVPTAAIADGITVSMDIPVSYMDNLEAPNLAVVVPIGKYVEVSGSYFNVSSVSYGYPEWKYNAGLKAGFAFGEDSAVKVAVGGNYSNEAEDGWLGNNKNAYLAITAKVLGCDLTANATYFFDCQAVNDEEFMYGFGLEKQLDENFKLGAEFIPANTVYGVMAGRAYGNVYGVMSFGDHLEVKGALTGVGTSTAVNIGFGYTF